jgi:hypothetical protein
VEDSGNSRGGGARRSEYSSGLAALMSARVPVSNEQYIVGAAGFAGVGGALRGMIYSVLRAESVLLYSVSVGGMFGVLGASFAGRGCGIDFPPAGN